MSADCGCHIDTRYEPIRIIHCSLHAAASEMLEALRQLVDYDATWDWERTEALHKQALEAIAHATQEVTP